MPRGLDIILWLPKESEKGLLLEVWDVPDFPRAREATVGEDSHPCGEVDIEARLTRKVDVGFCSQEAVLPVFVHLDCYKVIPQSR